MRKYRRFVTTGELRNKRNERREYLFGIMMVVIILVGLLGIGYLNIPNERLLGQTVLRGITYLPLLMLVMAVMGGLLCIIGLLLFADRNKGIGHYVKVVSYSLAFGMLFGGLGFNLLLNINDWLADKTPVRKEYRVTDINFLKRNKSWRKVPNYSLDCRIVETVCPDNFQGEILFSYAHKYASDNGLHVFRDRAKWYLWLESGGRYRVRLQRTFRKIDA
ncbi:hypothetical protein NXY49_12325 [Bacteroides fragilis]|nr:hypothetical protein [Bacteroides fragilis]